MSMREDWGRSRTGAESGLEVVGRWRNGGVWVGEGSGRVAWLVLRMKACGG